MATRILEKSTKPTPEHNLFLFIDLVSQSIEDNTSTIEISAYLSSNSYGSISAAASRDNQIYCNGESSTWHVNISHSGSIYRFLHNKIITIPHNVDGTKSISGWMEQDFNITYNGSYITSSTIVFNVALPAIPRSARVLSVSDFNDETNPTINYTNPRGNDVDLVEAAISLTGAVDNIKYREISKTDTSYTFELTEEERDILRASAPTSNTGAVRFYLRTTIDGVRYFNYATKTFTIINNKPILNPTIVDNSADEIIALTGRHTLIKYFSDVDIDMGASAVKKATLASTKMTNGSKVLTSATGTLYGVESGIFDFTVIDSRGNSATKTITKDIIDYVRLTCNMTVENPTAAGETVMNIQGNYFPGSFGVAVNELKLSYRYKTDGEYGDWITTTIKPTITGTTYKINLTITGLDYTRAYTFQAKAEDKLLSMPSAEMKVKSIPVFDWSEDDFNFNVPVNMNAEEFSMNGETILRHNTTANNIVLSASGGFIYMRPGGTTDTYSEVKITPQGNIDLKGDIILNGKSLTSLLTAAGIL